jgi:hypothetical protein
MQRHYPQCESNSLHFNLEKNNKRTLFKALIFKRGRSIQDEQRVGESMQ